MIRGLATAAAAVTVVVVCAGCTSSRDAASSPPPTPPASTTAPVITPPPTTSSAASPVASTTTSASATPTPTASATTPTSTPPAFTTTCTKITVRVIPGGAIRGAEIAALQYVNDGPAACRIGGFPTARLQLKGTAIGTVSAPVARPAKTITLQPGEVAESLLQDFSDCNAPLSDTVRVSLPVRPGHDPSTAVRPAKLRACKLRVNPLGPPA